MAISCSTRNRHVDTTPGVVVGGGGGGGGEGKADHPPGRRPRSDGHRATRPPN